MSERRRRLFLPAARETPAGGRTLGAWLMRSWPGRLLIAALFVLALRAAGVPVPAGLATLDTLLLLVFGGWALVVLGRRMGRRFLWRIRTKLIVSYLFIALVPVVLLGVLSWLVALLAMSLVTSYMVSVNVERDGQELELVAHTLLAGLEAPGAAGQRSPGAAELSARLADVRARHPSLGFSWVHQGRPMVVEGGAPSSLPAWLHDPGFAGVVQSGRARALRAVASSDSSFVALEVPFDSRFFAEVERRTGLRIFGDEHPPGPGQGITVHRDRRTDAPRPAASPPAPDSSPGVAASPAPGDTPFVGTNSVAFIPVRQWDTGEVDLKSLALRFQTRALLARLSPSSTDLPSILVTAVAVVACTFLVLYSVALVLGLLLARSITRSVHALTQGTERLRQGDFSRTIPMQSHDQLGELAESFNMMARSIEDLLRQSAEKERLEEELRIARQIQMSLLPRGAIGLPGLRISALCLPAEEVGGDYYDLLPLCETRLALLVADVSGKGTSAALYMAELKGLVLSLSRTCDSPARLLSEANRILAANMDARSFITMTYAVVDTAAGAMRYARAGHTPLFHFEASRARARVLAPPGLGLGMDAGPRFDAVLQEEAVPLAKGDIFLFFTDGLSEAMNEKAEMFGEGRLRELLERLAARDGQDLTALRDGIVDEIRGFVGEAPPHDDMTMVVLQVA